MDKRWTQDEAGQWWFLHAPSYPRRRGEVRICATCESEFPCLPSKTGQRGRFCSIECANKAPRPRRSRSGTDSPLWKGGRFISKSDGYAWVHIAPGQKGWRLEHRHVMSQHLGRELYAHETVHHINGVKDDNRIENLELWTGRHGKGVRHDEALAHCPTCTCFEH